MNDSLSEMQAFEANPVKIDFNKPPWVISKEILKLPVSEQGKWIDLWLEQPDIKADKEKRRIEKMVHPEPFNVGKKLPPDQHWQD